ncbi:pectate lyase 1-like protein, partial [Tanacetum coccineum]
VQTATKVWIDPCTMSKGLDWLLDFTIGSTGITISNCRFHDHDKTIHTLKIKICMSPLHSRFDTRCTQRMPRCRFGFSQVVNNDYCKWGIYVIGGSAKPTILSKGNQYVAPDDGIIKLSPVLHLAS